MSEIKIDGQSLMNLWPSICYSKYYNESTIKCLFFRIITESYTDFHVMSELPLSIMWTEGEIKSFKFQNFPQFTTGTDIVILEKSGNPFIFTENSYNQKFYEGLTDKKKQDIRDSLISNSCSFEIKCIKLCKSSPVEGDINESCYFCSGKKTSDLCHPEGEPDGSQYIVKGNATYHKEGQVVWDAFRAARVLDKQKLQSKFFLIALVEIPTRKCGNCHLQSFEQPQEDDLKKRMVKLIEEQTSMIKKTGRDRFKLRSSEILLKNKLTDDDIVIKSSKVGLTKVCYKCVIEFRK